MTIYVCLNTCHYAVQVLDTRITLKFRDGTERQEPPKVPGVAEGNPAIKQVAYTGAEPHGRDPVRFTLGYTGLAKLGRQSTAEVILDSLRTTGVGGTPKEIFDRFAQDFSRRFLEQTKTVQGHDRRLTLVANGFTADGASFFWRLTNFENEDGSPSETVNDAFTPHLRLYACTTRRDRKYGVCMVIGGSVERYTRSVTDCFFYKKYARIRRSGGWHRMSPRHSAKVIADWIQDYAENGPSDNYVSKECTAVMLTSEGEFSYGYFNDERNVVYRPLMLSPFVAFSHFEINYGVQDEK